MISIFVTGRCISKSYDQIESIPKIDLPIVLTSHSNLLSSNFFLFINKGKNATFYGQFRKRSSFSLNKSDEDA